MSHDTMRALLEATLAERYRIEGEAGAGGMATVYVARDIRHGRRVAIKVLHPELSAMLGGDRFLAEIKTTAALQHPHILPLFDSGSADGHLYYVMPFVEGETLRVRLTRETQLPIADAVGIARQVASALEHAHRRGVVHRDIKPENILLQDGQALVADFGIALAVQSAGGQRMTQTGLSLGTPQYMSPEQAMGEREITARSDVYALGAITYEMLVGEPPFTGPTTQSIVARVMTEEPRPLVAQRKSIPPAVEAAVLTALEKLPADRFGSAAGFSAALDGRAPAGAAPRAAAPPRGAVRRAAPWVVAIVALAAGLVGGRTLAAPGASSVRYTQKTFSEMVISLARYSPDGRTLLFSAGPQDRPPELFVIRPDYLEPQPLAQQQLHLLSVSSQGELAVLTRPVNVVFKIMRGTLARMPIGGGAPRDLVEGVRDAAWTPDGAGLAIIRDVGGADRLEYPIGTVLAQTAGWFSDPRFSPDGRQVAFLEHPWKWDDRGTIHLVDLAGKRTVLDTTEYSRITGVAWARDGREVYFSAKTPSAHQAVILGIRPGGSPREVLNGAGDLHVQDVAPDGRWLVTREVTTQQLLVQTPADSAPRPAGWLDFPFSPVISRDGALVAFGEASTESGVNYSVMMRDTKGGRAVRLGEGYPLEFSRDHASVLAIVPLRPGRLVIYPTGAGTERVVPTAGMMTLDVGGWAHDERSVWYCGNAAGKGRTCQLKALAGGAPVRYHPGALGPSPDGRFALVGSRGHWLLVSPSTGDTIRAVPGTTAADVPHRWGPDGRSIWVGRAGVVEALDLSSGARTRLASDPSVARATSGVSKGLVLADDPGTRAFLPARVASELFEVKGPR
jgi:tRNA A-37 threonylcarbamoyl transferase component Bud32